MKYKNIIIVLAVLFFFSLASVLYAEMFARYDKSTLVLQHWSTAPFSKPAAASEADQKFPDGTTLPGPPGEVRLSNDLKSLSRDPALKPSPPSQTQDQLDRANLKDKIKAAIKDPSLSQGVKDIFTALEKLF